MNPKTLLSIAAVAAFSQLTGCALVPVTANLDVPVAKTVSATGPAVKVVSVTDNRKFVYPHVAGECETPSVENEKMLNDTDAKARAFGRQGRCTKGEWAMHTMVSLPVGQSVAAVTRSTIEAGLADAGYQITDNDQNAIPVVVTIDNFWTWNDMDGMGNMAHAWITVNLSSPGVNSRLDANIEKKRYFGFSNPAPDDMSESLLLLRSKASKIKL